MKPKIEKEMIAFLLKNSKSNPKKRVLKKALKEVIKNQLEIKQYRGKLKWTGNLDKSRKDYC